MVQGESVFMHQMAFLDLETCLPQKPPCFCISSRFSELSCFHKQLEDLHPRVALPQFPPKKWLGSKSSSFLAERMTQLNDYFSSLLETEEVCNSRMWEVVFAPKKSYRIAVVGCPGIGKIRLVEGFLNCTAETRLEALGALTTDTRGSEIGQVCPIDLLVRQSLVRLKTLTILQYTKSSDLSAMRLLSGYDGVVLTYLEQRPETYEAVVELKTRLAQKTVLVSLDEGQGSAGEYVRTTEDAYLVFHHLLESM